MHITDVARSLPQAIHHRGHARTQSHGAAKASPQRDVRLFDASDRGPKAKEAAKEARVTDHTDGLNPRHVKHQLRRIAKHVGAQLEELTRDLAKTDHRRTDVAPSDEKSTDPVAVIRELGQTFRHELRTAFRDARVAPHRIDAGRLLDGVESAFDRLVTDLRTVLQPAPQTAPAPTPTVAASHQPTSASSAQTAVPIQYDGAKPDGAKPDGAKPDGAKPDGPNDVAVPGTEKTTATSAGVGALAERLQAVLAELRSAFAGTDLRAKLTFSIEITSRVNVLS